MSDLWVDWGSSKTIREMWRTCYRSFHIQLTHRKWSFDGRSEISIDGKTQFGLVKSGFEYSFQVFRHALLCLVHRILFREETEVWYITIVEGFWERICAHQREWRSRIRVEKCRVSFGTVKHTRIVLLRTQLNRLLDAFRRRNWVLQRNGGDDEMQAVDIFLGSTLRSPLRRGLSAICRNALSSSSFPDCEYL